MRMIKLFQFIDKPSYLILLCVTFILNIECHLLFLLDACLELFEEFFIEFGNFWLIMFVGCWEKDWYFANLTLNLWKFKKDLLHSKHLLRMFMNESIKLLSKIKFPHFDSFMLERKTDYQVAQRITINFVRILHKWVYFTKHGKFNLEGQSESQLIFDIFKRLHEIQRSLSLQDFVNLVGYLQQLFVLWVELGGEMRG